MPFRNPVPAVVVLFVSAATLVAQDPIISGKVVDPTGAAVSGAAVQYSGAAPRFSAGLMQVNVVVPAGLGAGPLPLYIVMDGIASQSGITVTLK